MSTNQSPVSPSLYPQYTGKVLNQGPSAVRELRSLVIRKASVGAMDNNVYLLTCRVSGAQLLIDAATDVPRLMRLIREGSPDSRLDQILTTHSHFDHVGALSQLAAATGARTLAGADDAPDIACPIDVKLQHQDLIRVGVNELEVVHLRGHTPGSIALIYDAGLEGAHVFTGDSLFPGGVGASGGDRKRFLQLFNDVKDRIFDRLADDAWVYPGHGADTTIGAERGELDNWLERGY